MTENFKTEFGNRLSLARKEKGITQQQLSEMINYSDKAVSKWERGESIPDVFTLCDICEKLEISLDYLCGNNQNTGQTEPDAKPEKGKNKKVISTFVPAISVAGVFFICSVLYFVLKNIPLTSDYASLSFLLAVPVSFIVLLVMSFIWWHSRSQFICLSGLIWSIGISAYIIIGSFFELHYPSYIFISCAILQTIAILVFVFVRKLKHSE